MSIKALRYFLKGIELRGEATDISDQVEGALFHNSTDHRLRTYIESAVRNIVTDTQTQTLTNKTIDLDLNTISNIEVDNFKTGVITTTISGSPTDLTLPTTKAVKDYVDPQFATGASNLQAHLDDTLDAHDASAISFDNQGDLSAENVQDAVDELRADSVDIRTRLTAHINNATDAHDASAISVVPTGNLSSVNAQAALVELQTDINTNASTIAAHTGASTGVHGITGAVVGTTDTQTLTNKTIDADANTITNIDNADIKAAAAIARSKLASGTNYRLLANSATGVMSENAALTSTRIPFADANGQLTDAADLTVGTNSVILGNTKHLELQAANDATTTGTNASLTAFTGGSIRLTNASLASLANIPAGANGQQVVLFNRVGSDVMIPDSSAAVGTAANRILTGTNTTLTLTNNAAIKLQYDSTTARWQVIGGSGGGGGGSTSLDTIFQLTSAEQLTEWSTGNNASFLGGGTLSGSFVKNTSTPLHGAASYTYTQAAGSLNDYIASAVQPVDLRFRGTQVYLSFPYTYNGLSTDLQIVVYCATTATVLTTAFDLITASNSNTVATAAVIIPTTCTGVRFGIQVKTLNSGKILQFDDVQLSSNLYGNTSTIITQGIEFAGSSTTFGSTNTGVPVFTPTKNDNNGVIRVDISAANGTSFTAVVACEVKVTVGGSVGTAASVSLTKNSTGLTLGTLNGAVGNSAIAAAASNTTSANLTLAPGDVVRAQRNNANMSEINYFTLTATTVSSAIATPTQQISSDTLPFTFKATPIVDADPIGTFNTYTYAAAGNTAVISASAPTQTATSMNSNGFQVFGRAFSATSTTASPARVDIKIGKGLKSISTSAFNGAAKTIGLCYDMIGVTTTTLSGAAVTYNELTGIVSINAGVDTTAGASTTRRIGFDSTTASFYSDGYFVFNASTAPSIAALPILQPRIATLSDVKASGTAGGTSTAGLQTRTLNTLVDTTGVVTSLTANQFILSAGTYYIDASTTAYQVVNHRARLQNISDSVSALLGSCEATQAATNNSTRSVISGEIVISSPKTFELQHYTATAVATNGLGVATGYGQSEVYSVVKITKVR